MCDSPGASVSHEESLFHEEDLKAGLLPQRLQHPPLTGHGTAATLVEAMALPSPPHRGDPLSMEPSYPEHMLCFYPPTDIFSSWFPQTLPKLFPKSPSSTCSETLPGALRKASTEEAAHLSPGPLAHPSPNPQPSAQGT